MRLLSFGVLLLLFSCSEPSGNLPVLGRHDYDTKYVDGELATDTIFYTLPDFELTNQYGDLLTRADLEGRIHVADFFFTSCPTICPKMSRNMLRISEELKEESGIAFLSISIDPKHDSVSVLKEYYDKLGSTNNNWHLLTGGKEEIFSLADDYMVAASEDPHAPGGLVHSGAFILADTKGRIRAYYDGTVEEDVDKLLKDIRTLLNEI